ncbi:MAG: GIY-YIG nuclease family protein [Candidatus Gracilibacteria bacterium]|nr:GIY-YIG nuclease family protein [Candidatus Gracilibacteria bacterium]
MKYYIYILECSDATLYTGFTKNLEKRVETHNAKKGAKYTRGRTPVTLKYFEEFDTESEARKREYKIKQLSRNEKFSLIEVFNKNLNSYEE